MIFDDSLLVESFKLEKIPSWICPHCDMGRLILIGKFTTIETEESKETQKDDWSDPSYKVQQYYGVFECSSCKNKVVNAGYIVVEDFYDEQDGMIYQGWKEIYYPKYFYPSLNLIAIKKLPKKIQNALLNSCNLFWFDRSATANAIRTLVEDILTEEGIKRFEINKKRKRRLLTLHQRLELFNKIKAKESHLLMAVKWIGNYGSHTDKLKHDDLCKAFKLVNNILEKLYSNEDVHLKKIATKYIKSKGPTKKRRKKGVFTTKGVDTSSPF